jgi:hypothetical protein
MFWLQITGVSGVSGVEIPGAASGGGQPGALEMRRAIPGHAGAGTAFIGRRPRNETIAHNVRITAQAANGA